MAEALVGLIVKGLGAAGVAVGAVGTALIQIGVGLVLSAVAQAKQRNQRAPGIQTPYTGRGDVSPQTVILGRYATNGHQIAPMYTHSRAPNAPGDNNFGTIGQGDVATFIINIADTPVSGLSAFYIDGVRFDMATQIGGTSHWHYGPGVTSGQDRDDWVNKVFIKFYDGTQTAADPYLRLVYGSHPTRPWKETSWHRGGAYAIITVLRDRTLFRGAPEFRFEVDGLPLYDPRTDSVGFTTNPAVMCWNIFAGVTLPDGSTFGMGVAPADLPADWWDAAMDAADALVENADGADEAQYRAGIEIPMATPDNGGMDPLSAIDALLPSMSAQVADLGGMWIIRAGGPGLSVVSFSDDDVLNSRDQSYAPFPGLAETHNAVAATFPNPAAKWEATEAPPRFDLAAEAEDGQRLIASLDLNTVPYGDQVQRLMVAWAADALRRRVHVLSLPPYLDAMTVLDTVALTSDVHGYTAKLFEVQEYIADLTTGAIRLVQREVDPADFTPDPANYLPQDVVQVTRTPAAPLALSSFDATAHQITDGTVGKKPAIRLTWTVSSANLDGVAWEVYRGAELVIAGSTAKADAGEVILSDNVLPGTSYTCRGIPLADAQLTAWSSFEPVTTDNIKPGLSDLDGEVQDAIDDAAQSALDDKDAAEEAAEIALVAKGIAVGIGRNPYFELGFEGWAYNREGTGLMEDLPTVFAIVAGVTANKALEVKGHRSPMSKALIPVDTARSYEVDSWLRATGAGGSVIFVGVECFDASGAFITGGTRKVATAGVNPTVPVDGIYHQYKGTITGEGSGQAQFAVGTKFVKLQAFVNYNQTASYITLIDRLILRDVTEVKNAEGFATAASNSATSASTSATTAAGHVVTASGHASTATTQAGYASASASAAAYSAEVAARTYSSAFGNPIFADWPGTLPDGVLSTPATGGTISKATDGDYGNAIVINTGATLSANGPSVYIRSADALLNLPRQGDTLALRLRMELSLVSGVWSGSLLRIQWIGGTGGTSAQVDYYLEDLLSTATGDTQLLDLVVERPDSYVKGSSGHYVQITLSGTTNTGGKSRAQSVTRMHRWDVEGLLANASAYIAQAAKTSVDGWAQSLLGFQVKAGTGGAELELMAFSDALGAYTAARLQADNILLQGSVTADFLTITEWLDIDAEEAGFRMGKQSINDATISGMFAGRFNNGGVEQFGFAVGTNYGGFTRDITITGSEFTIRNADFTISASAASTETWVQGGPASTEIILDPTHDSLSLYILGQGGGNANGNNGNNAVVQLYDGSTFITSWTAAGGVKGGASSHLGQSGYYGFYGRGADGQPYRPGTSEGSEQPYVAGGARGQALTILRHDISALTAPKIILLLPLAGSSGYWSAVKYQTAQENVNIPAAPTALAPSITGTFVVTAGVAVTFPVLAIARGQWVLTDAPNNARINVGNGQQIICGALNSITFNADGTPSFTTHHNQSITVRYAFYPMKET